MPREHVTVVPLLQGGVDVYDSCVGYECRRWRGRVPIVLHYLVEQLGQKPHDDLRPLYNARAST